ncbi:MAG TPA: hypothetical protein VGJ14_05305 [Sporichthyaceae bacterium]|jgi:hypothetical protein
MNTSKSAARLGVVAAMIATTALSGAAAASAHSHHGEIKGEVSSNRGHQLNFRPTVRLFEVVPSGTGDFGAAHQFHLIATTTTDKHGDFKFKHLAHGRYYVEALGDAAASPLSDAGLFRSEFFQNSLSIENSKSIKVKSDKTVKLEEIKLTRN